MYQRSWWLKKVSKINILQNSFSQIRSAWTPVVFYLPFSVIKLEMFMIRITGIAIVLLSITQSCKKGATTNQSVSVVASSIIISEPDYHRSTVDSFVRDANNRLTKFVRIFNDSTSLPFTPYKFECVFKYVGNDSMPSSYNRIFPNASEVHKLQYDGQGRIILDSSSTISQNTFYFSYSVSGTILYQQLPPNVGHYIDTITLINGNITERKYWFFTPTHTIHSNYNATYSSLANPLGFTSNMGALLFEMSGQMDYLSKNLVNQSWNELNVISQLIWGTDVFGRVINGVETYTISGVAYKKNIIYRYD